MSKILFLTGIRPPGKDLHSDSGDLCYLLHQTTAVLDTERFSLFERELALQVALQGESIWKEVFFRQQLEDSSPKVLKGPSAVVAHAPALGDL